MTPEHESIIDRIRNIEFSFHSLHDFGGMRERQTEIEELAWRLHDEGSAVGSIILADRLSHQRFSRIKESQYHFDLPKELFKNAFVRLVTDAKKSKYDWYYQGYCYEKGRGVDQDFKASAECYRKAFGSGLDDALFESAWMHYLFSANADTAIQVFLKVVGNTKEYADKAIGLLTIIDKQTPPLEADSSAYEYWNALTEFLTGSLYQDTAKRRVYERIEKQSQEFYRQHHSELTAEASLIWGLMTGRCRSFKSDKSWIQWMLDAIERGSVRALEVTSTSRLPKIDDLRSILIVARKAGILNEAIEGRIVSRIDDYEND